MAFVAEDTEIRAVILEVAEEIWPGLGAEDAEGSPCGGYAAGKRSSAQGRWDKAQDLLLFEQFNVTAFILWAIMYLNEQRILELK